MKWNMRGEKGALKVIKLNKSLESHHACNENDTANDKQLGRKRPSFKTIPTADCFSQLCPSLSVGPGHTFE